MLLQLAGVALLASFLALAAGMAAAGPAAAGSATPSPGSALPSADPAHSLRPSPDYYDVCPVTLDSSPLCLRLTLGAIDRARAAEGLGALELPAAFGRLPVPEQLFVVVDAERVTRGLAPFVGLSAALVARAQRGADRGMSPAVRPGSGQVSDWIGAINNGLDADFQWMYADGPSPGQSSCISLGMSSCWEDRNLLLRGFRPARGRALAMGAALDSTGDDEHGDMGGPSLAVVLGDGPVASSSYVYTWAEARAATDRGTLAPIMGVPRHESTSGIRDPRNNIPPEPDYLEQCAPSGIDDSAHCISATLAAINHVHALEGVPPMVLPTDFAQLPIPEQLFVVIDLERVDRGLRPLVGLTARLDANAQKGADTANDPPDAGPAYLQTDGEWSGGNSNGLDADYGWMYYDGYNAGNLDCPHPTSPGCWGHRTGILDDFGTGGTLEMGAAFDPTGDNNRGDVGGPSMAVTLAVTYAAPGALVFTWAQVTAQIPGWDVTTP